MKDHLIPFIPDQMPEEPDIDTMDAQQLWAYREDLENQIASLNVLEPSDEESEEYEDWADRHEYLEDLLDEVIDRLEDIGE